MAWPKWPSVSTYASTGLGLFLEPQLHIDAMYNVTTLSGK